MGGGRWWAVDPTSDMVNWFASRKKPQGKHWSDRFANIMLFIPRKGARVGKRRFGIIHAALYAELYSFSKANNPVLTTLAGLGKLLNGTDETTVRSGLDLLAAADLLHVGRQGNRLAVKVNAITEKHLDLFSEAPQARQGSNPTAPPQRPEFTRPIYENVYSFSVGKGIPHEIALEITQLYGRFPDIEFEEFVRMADIAAREHHYSRKTGRSNVSHCGFLLRYKLKDVLDLMESRRSVSSVGHTTVDDINQQNTAEAKAEARRRKAEIRANPLHEDHTIDDWAIRARVQVNMREIGQIEGHVYQRIGRFADSQTSNVQESVRLSGNLYQEVMAHALDRINGYYNNETKASRKQFEEAINAVLAERGIEPITFCMDG